MTPAPEDEAENTMMERGEESTPKLWVLIYAPRWLLTAFSVATMFALLVLAMRFGPSSLEKILAADDVSTLFAAILGAIVTSVTLILTVTQLVISQEIGSLSEQNRRLETQQEFRTRVEDRLGLDVSPSEPALFFQALVKATAAQGRALSASATDARFEGADAVARYADGVVEHATAIESDLEGTEFGSFAVLSSVLDYNYSRKVHEARRLRNKHGDVLSEDVDDAIRSLVETLRFYGPTRGFFKTLYFQWELIDVSRHMVYAALPVLAIAGYMVLAFEATAISGATLGFHNLYLVTSAAFAVSLTPFILLLAYVTRILSVLKRTLAPGSFVLRSTNRDEEIHWTD